MTRAIDGSGHDASDAGLACTVVHQPGVHVAQHLAVQAVGGRIGLEGDPQSSGAEGCHVASGGGEGMPGVPGAVDHQDGQVPAGLHSPQGQEAVRQPAVDRDHAGESFGVTEAEAVGGGRPLAAAHQEDPLGMNVQQAASLPDRGEDAFLEAVDVIRLGIEEGAANDLGFGPPRPGRIPMRSWSSKSRPQPNPARRSRLMIGSGPRRPSPT